MDAQENRELAKRILLEILRQNSGRVKATTRLYKAFYMAHLYYYQKGWGLLSDWPIVHMPNGPGIHRGLELLQELEDDGCIKISQQQKGPYLEAVYELVSPDPSELRGQQVEAIKAAVDFVRGKSAAELSDLTHEFSRSWNNGQNGDPLNIYVDILDDKEYERIAEELDQINQDVSAVFGA